MKALNLPRKPKEPKPSSIQQQQEYRETDTAESQNKEQKIEQKLTSQ